ncbi:MAG: phosphate acyltransferase [bacterium]|nr:phosphate acyltransferase [bacterium]
MQIEKFADIVKILKEQTRPITVIVAPAQDELSLHAVEYSYRQLGNSIVDILLVGDKEEIDTIINRDKLALFLKEKIIDIKDKDEAVYTAMQLIRDGKAHILAKGKITSDQLMRLVLDETRGLRKPGNIISHIRVFETPKGMLLMSDGGIIIHPTPAVKQKILDNAVEVAKRLGLEPKPAELSGTYTFAQAMQDGANILIMPWITPGNIVYKSVIHELPWTLEYERTLSDSQGGIIYIFRKATIEPNGGYLFIAAAVDTADYVKKKRTVQLAIETAKNYGLGKSSKLKIGLIDFTEQLLLNVSSIYDSVKLVEEYKVNPEVIVEGPMAYDIVISAEAARIKNFMGNKSQVAGDPDIIFCPDADSALFLTEVYQNFDKWRMPWIAGDIAVGGTNIVLIPSRSDAEAHKFHSLITAFYLNVSQ